MLVKWKWWYPPGCIDAGTIFVDEFASPYPPDDGEEAASEIIDRYIGEYGTDGQNEFEIEITEPAAFAGVYDIALEWSPSAYATQRALDTNASRACAIGAAPGEQAVNSQSSEAVTVKEAGE